MGNQTEIKINAYTAFDTSRPVADLQKENLLKSRLRYFDRRVEP